MDQQFIHCVFTLLCAAILPLTRTSLQQFSYQDYVGTLQLGKTSLIYFSNSVSPSIGLFLDELNKSVEHLQDFGVSVAMVNCKEKSVSKYCGVDNVYLFRGEILLREFPKDTLFNVNAIVSNVLFALLFNEVKYITLFEEFQKIENALKGNGDLVFTYVKATGIAEHRAVMESAFVYGTKYQFILTTEFTVLANLEVEEPDLLNAVLFFCHCKVLPDLSQPCKRTMLEQSLTTLNIHKFFKLMEAPLVTLVDTDPGKISTVHVQLGLPLIFIISQKHTYDVDKVTAEHIAWKVLGKAGIAIFLREIASSKIPLGANVALKRAKDGASIKFLFLGNVEEIAILAEVCTNEDQMIKYVVEDDQVVPEQDIQDDEVAEAVYRDRKRKLPFQLVLPLTEKSFYSTVTADALTVVLFYFKWEAVSVAFLQSYVEVTIALKETPDVLMTMVNCGDWPTICNKEGVLDVPRVMVYFKKGKPLMYSGMFGTEPLYRFIVLFKKCHATGLESPPTCKNLKNDIHDHNPLFLKPSASEVFQVPHHDYLPELSVENLPFHLNSKQPLLILFSDGKLSHSDQMEMSMLLKGKHLDAFSTCWLNLKNTPVGGGLLKQYFTSLPDLPVLVMLNLFSTGYVFAFPTGQFLTGQNILNWLSRISEGTENPVSLLSDKEWMPSISHFDFLGMMDATMPSLASQKIPIHFSPRSVKTNENNGEEYNKEDKVNGDKNALSPAVGVKVMNTKFRGRNIKSKGRLDL